MELNTFKQVFPKSPLASAPCQMKKQTLNITFQFYSLLYFLFYGFLIQFFQINRIMINNPYKLNQTAHQSKSNKNKNNHSSKVAHLSMKNPFLREFLVSSKDNVRKSRVSKIKNSSEIRTNSLSHYSYADHWSDKDQSMLQRSICRYKSSDTLQLQFRKDRQFQIERKRIDLFGPQVLRVQYNGNTVNPDYFELSYNYDKPNKNGIFQNNRKMYGRDQDSRNLQPEENSQIYEDAMIKQNSTAHFLDYKTNKLKVSKNFHPKQPSEFYKSNPYQQGISQKQSSQLKIQNKQNLNQAPSFGCIKHGQPGRISQSMRKKMMSSIQLAHNLQKSGDEILEMSDGFHMQRNSVSSSLISNSQFAPKNEISQNLFNGSNNFNHLNYNSNFGRPLNSSFSRTSARQSRVKKMSFTSQYMDEGNNIIKNNENFYPTYPSTLTYDGIKFNLIEIS